MSRLHKVSWRPQPEGTRCCGQVALAVVADLTLEEAVRIVGHNHGTTTKELVKALRGLGFRCSDRCRRLSLMPRLAIAQAHIKGKSGWHWMAVEGGPLWDVIYDGNASGIMYREAWEREHPGWRITSYLPVVRP